MTGLMNEPMNEPGATLPDNQVPENPAPENPDSEDAAWVSIETPFPAEELRGFLDDPERLFRINSYLEFKRWDALGGGHYRIHFRNQSNDTTLATEISATPMDDGLRVVYADGLKTETVFRVEPGAEGGPAKLTVTDDYSGTPKEEREARVDEADKSLAQWGRDLHRYLHQWKRWSWLPGWRWYRRKVWQSMSPRGRRISYMLLVITALEFLAFLMVFFIFWLELDRFFG